MLPPLRNWKRRREERMWLNLGKGSSLKQKFTTARSIRRSMCPTRRTLRRELASGRRTGARKMTPQQLDDLQLREHERQLRRCWGAEGGARARRACGIARRRGGGEPALQQAVGAQPLQGVGRQLTPALRTQLGPCHDWLSPVLTLSTGDVARARRPRICSALRNSSPSARPSTTDGPR